MAVDFDYAKAWRPEPGDILEGLVTEITEYDGGGYGKYPIVTVEEIDGGSVAIHAFHTVLRNELARLDVQIGERIAVLYAGKQQTRDGTTAYEGYRVKCPDRKSKRFDWGDDGGDPTDAADLEPPADAPRAESKPHGDEDIPF